MFAIIRHFGWKEMDRYEAVRVDLAKDEVLEALQQEYKNDRARNPKSTDTFYYAQVLRKVATKDFGNWADVRCFNLRNGYSWVEHVEYPFHI